MKVKVVPTIIAAAISALIAFGFYSWCTTDDNQMLMGIGSFVVLFLAMALSLGVRFEGRTTASTVAVGIVGFVALLVANIVFCFVDFGVATYVIVNGILLLIMILVAYAVAQAKQ